MPLTETRLRALKPKEKPYKVADDRGLYVEVTPSGGKLWRFRYRIGKLEKKLSIGNYPDISLKDARQATYEARQAVARGGDPALEKRKQKIRSEFLSAQTFEAVAREYPPGAIVAFRTLENGHEDDWEWEYECLIEEVIETACCTFPSLGPCDGWRGREDASCCATPLLIAGSLPTAGLSPSGSSSATTVVTRMPTPITRGPDGHSAGFRR